ncbi:TPA: hypothetical protein ACOELP_001014 [Enterobacter hormaechei]
MNNDRIDATLDSRHRLRAVKSYERAEDFGGGNGGGGGLESRIAILEADVKHIHTTLTDIKEDIRGLRADIREGFSSTRTEFREDLTKAKGDLVLSSNEIKTETKALEKRVSDVESAFSSMKTTIKVSGAVVSAIFIVCTYFFGSYVTKILDALNGLVLK